jgi:Asp-tRNA(Asn)/Glu-tRNA(Gln) amidotransferase A subunit family amidase
MKTPPHTLSAIEAASRIRGGQLSSESLVQACLDRIAERDADVRAWAWLDGDQALKQAQEMDRIRKAGHAVGALHGVPVGLKDIIDTRDMPTERGTPVFAGRRPDADAAIVERLRDAGAVVLGKTKTTELAFMHGADTRNPHNLAHSPGGSSSGSAAAVADFQVPLAIGSQTGGSVIRPASFCGVYGIKPTRGVISRRGVLQTSVTLDQMGCFGRSLQDAALLADAIGSFDPTDPASFPRPRPQMLQGAQTEVPVPPSIAWFDMPYHDRLTADAREGMEEVIKGLGGQVERYHAAPELAGLVEVQATIHEYEFCQHLADVIAGHWDQLSDSLKPVVRRGQQISRAEYEDALAVMASAQAFFAKFYNDFDAILSLGATGEAPLFGPGTGDPIFCTIWTLAGLPAVTLPLLVGETGLPIGVQLIGAAEEDDRLLRTASWVQDTLKNEA